MAINITLEQVKALLKTSNQTILEEKRSGNNLGTVLRLSNGCIIIVGTRELQTVRERMRIKS